MRILSKIKIGPFLVISSVLAVWMLLAVQHVQAHTSTEPLPTPGCGSLPAADFFGDTQTTAIADGTVQADRAIKVGEGVLGRGNTKHHYAKITVPTLTAGELRVFDTSTAGPSDAVLCRGSTQVARSVTSYSAHNSASSAATAAARAATTASTIIENPDTDPTTGTVTTVPDSNDFNSVDSARTQVRNGLSAARSALGAAARALNVAAATTPSLSPTQRDTVAGYASTARTDEATALAAYNGTVTASDDTDGTRPDYPTGADDAIKLAIVVQALSNARAALEAARNALDATGSTDDAAGRLTASGNLAHEGFQLRAAVAPGDEEYILVVAKDPTTADTTFSAQFHGAIAAADVKQNRSLSAGVTDTITINITAPGLLTLETTGSTDTVGTLDRDPTGSPIEIAYAESGGSGGNFKIVAPVILAAYGLEVDGQDTREFGAYTLDMDFKVAMAAPSTSVTINPAASVPLAPTASPWNASVTVAADDTMVRIQRRAADGNVADEDYFLFTPANSGFLTVNANDDNTAAPDANTSGTLFGAMGQGPEMVRRTGQIATDANSGPGGTHFKFAVPVEGGRNYLVKVEGTDGAYALEFELTAATTADSGGTAFTVPITLPRPSIDAALTARERDWYLFNIEEPGTLYMETSGPTDVVGYLSGPDGSMVAEDDNSGTGTNFRIAVNVAPGLYILEVEGQTTATVGDYTLVSSFVAGPGPDPTTPTEPTTPPTEPEPETDATGALGNPPPGSTRSGIGIISGWVCQASNVTITISPVGEGGTTLSPFTIGYGADRPDTVGECDHTSPDTGFGMAFNFNRLAEGQYQITAQADGQQIGSSRQFTVIHLVPGDDFPEDLESEPVEVPNFPTAGETTTLEWETESQGFVITDVQ